MDTLTAHKHLQRGRDDIRQALEQWDPADLSRVEDSRRLLAAAVGDLRAFESAVRNGSVPATGELRATLLAIKQEVGRATRVVDACVAFHRGLAARIGGGSSGYDAEGRLAGECAGLEPEVLA
jgi:hypothetical protein